MRALVVRHAIPKGDIERARLISPLARGTTERSDQPSQIKFIAFPFWSTAHSAIPNLGRASFGHGGHSNSCPVTAGRSPFTAPRSPTGSEVVR